MPDWILQLLAIVGASCGVYAGVKADIAKAIVRAEMALQLAERAHARIDAIMK